MSSYREIELNGIKLKCYSCGKIESFTRNRWQILKGTKHTNKDGYIYYTIAIKHKSYKIHRVIGLAFLNLDINNPTQQIDHIDRNNNSISNLRIVSNQQNQFNMNAKGYCWDKIRNKWKASIKLNSKSIHLGYHDNEEDAKLAYLKAKEQYHIIS